MKIFKDNAGRSWPICINVDSIRRVKAMTAVNLIEALDGKLIETISADPVVLCDVIYALVKPEADVLKLSPEDFGKAMGGDAIDHATNAFLEELIDFFPQRQRQILSKALIKLKEVQSKVTALAETRMEALDVDALLKTASESSGSLQA